MMDYASYERGFNDAVMLAPKATAPYLVFADAPGYSPPTFKHPTRGSAEKEAQRLSNLNPGVNYYVVGSLSITSSVKPSATTRSLVN